MSLVRKVLVVLVPIALLACKVSTDPYMPLRVTGTITQGGQPAAAVVRLSAGGNAASRLFEDGVFDISTTAGGVPESFCAQVAIEASLVGPDLQTVLAQDSRDLGRCGDLVVEFAFP